MSEGAILRQRPAVGSVPAMDVRGQLEVGRALTWLISGRRQGAVLVMTAAWDPSACFGCAAAGDSAALQVLLSLAGVSAHAHYQTPRCSKTLQGQKNACHCCTQLHPPFAKTMLL